MKLEDSDRAVKGDRPLMGKDKIPEIKLWTGEEFWGKWMKCNQTDCDEYPHCGEVFIGKDEVKKYTPGEKIDCPDYWKHP